MCGNVQEVHWRHAEEETEALKVAEAAPDVNGMAANISDQPVSVAAEQQTWLHSGIEQEPAAYTAYPGSSYFYTGVGDQSSAGTPWADWASVGGSAAPKAAAFTQVDPVSTEEAAAMAAGRGVADSGQWSPAELAAQAKAWADWAAWQAQSAAQPSQGSSHVWPSGAVAHPSSAVGQPTMVDAASSMPEQQPSSAELVGNSPHWDWGDRPVQHAAPATDHSQASQSAGSQQGAAQAHQTAQAGEAESVTVPVSLYKRYQALEWAEWHRQYESWQAQYSSWYACYEHWYSSYLAWYNVHGGSAS